MLGGGNPSSEAEVLGWLSTWLKNEKKRKKEKKAVG